MLTSKTSFLLLGSLFAGTVWGQAPSPTITINDVTNQFETSGGTGAMQFTVSITPTVSQQVSMIYSTADVTARGGHPVAVGSIISPSSRWR